MTPRQNAIDRRVRKDQKPVPVCTEAFFIKGRCVACGRPFRSHYPATKEAKS